MTPAPSFELLTSGQRRIVAAAARILERRARCVGDLLKTPWAVLDYLRVQYAGEARERFRVLFLNAQNRLIAAEELFVGTLRHVSVYPREIARRALALNAASVILAHNHPSGCAEPSLDDERVTEEIRKALHLIDVNVLDHVVVAGGVSVYMSEWQEQKLVVERERKRRERLARRRRPKKAGR